jgi:hypothetical protein
MEEVKKERFALFKCALFSKLPEDGLDATAQARGNLVANVGPHRADGFTARWAEQGRRE